MTINASKGLGRYDESGFLFAQEMLCGDVTAAINFDRLQVHPDEGYIIFEYLLCGEKQKVTPYTSHPSRYWNKNSRKFLALWAAAKKMDAKLYLVNYAKAGSVHEDKIKLIRVLDLDSEGIKQEDTKCMSRAEFQEWFRALNAECLRGLD